MTSTPSGLKRRRLLQAAAGSAVLALPVRPRPERLAEQTRHLHRAVPGRLAATDAFARPLTAQLTKSLGKQVIIDNRGGCRRHGRGDHRGQVPQPDGYTFFMGRRASHDRARSDVPQARLTTSETDLHPRSG